MGGKKESLADQEYWIRRLDQLQALESPMRQRIVATLEDRGPSTVAEIAEDMGRIPESLYYHVRMLVDVELLVVCDQRGAGRRQEAVYRSVAPVLRLDYENRDDDWNRGLERAASAYLRAAGRQYAEALTSPEVRRSGDRREVRVMQINVRLGEEALAEVHRRMDELHDYCVDEHRKGEGTFYSLTALLTRVMRAREPGT